jgi:hypothetical protein
MTFRSLRFVFMNNTANTFSTGAPPLHHALLRGGIGFTFVSLGGFAVWAFGGDWFYTFFNFQKR